MLINGGSNRLYVPMRDFPNAKDNDKLLNMVEESPVTAIAP